MNQICEIYLKTKDNNQFYMYMKKCRACCTDYYRNYRIYKITKKIKFIFVKYVIKNFVIKKD